MNTREAQSGYETPRGHHRGHRERPTPTARCSCLKDLFRGVLSIPPNEDLVFAAIKNTNCACPGNACEHLLGRMLSSATPVASGVDQDVRRINKFIHIAARRELNAVPQLRTPPVPHRTYTPDNGSPTDQPHLGAPGAANADASAPGRSPVTSDTHPDPYTGGGRGGGKGASWSNASLTRGQLRGDIRSTVGLRTSPVQDVVRGHHAGTRWTCR
ncbi:hypothetical protein Vretimale_15229, partial [Volvox reticuliferus]